VSGYWPARWISRAQFEQLAQTLPEHLPLAARFAVYTGLRIRSMLQLTWDRVDLVHSRFWIPGQQMKGKNAHSMPISRLLAALLRQLKAANPEGAHVFHYKGKLIDDCNTRAFQEAVRRSGLAPLRWHDLRRTFAAWVVQSGVTAPELMALGAWKSHSMALRYAHLSPDHLAHAAERVGRA
jgi:integrase